MEATWKIAVETTNGIVALWFSWLENSIKLFYPSERTIPDSFIKETFHVTLVDVESHNRFGKRGFSKSYYSDKFVDGKRIMIGHESDHVDSFELSIIQNYDLLEDYFGGFLTNTVYTYFADTSIRLEPEDGISKQEKMQMCKKDFLRLLIRIAKEDAYIKAFNLECEGEILTPARLRSMNYNVEKRKEGKKEICYTKNSIKGFEIILVRKEFMAPWTTVIRYTSITKLSKVENLLNQIDKQLKGIIPCEKGDRLIR